MIQTVQKMVKNYEIPMENCVFYTGLSSCEWVSQMKERFPMILHSNIYHRSEHKKFVDKIKDKKNILIILDEIQVAAKKNQTIYKSFEKAGLLNKSKLYKNDIKIIEFTATPDGTIYDLMKWGDSSGKTLVEAGKGYVSSFDLLKMGRIRQYKDLCGYNKKYDEVDYDMVLANLRELKEDIDNYGEDDPLYHIIRTKTGIEYQKTIDNFKLIFPVEEYGYEKYNQESIIKDVNQIVSVKPTKHTFVFIKEMLRCAKTLVKTYIGVLVERYSENPDDSSVIQGLVGRDTGYNNNGKSICYTNISSIERYEQLWNSQFEDTSIPWNSKTTQFRNGSISSKDTFNDPKNYDGFSIKEPEVVEPIIQIFKTRDEAREYYNQVLKEKLKGRGRGPNKSKKQQVDGFYHATIRSQERVYTCQDIFNERRHGLTPTNYRLYPCYEDEKDTNTLQWWFIHY